MSGQPINSYESPRELCRLPIKRWDGDDWFVRLLWVFLVAYCGMTLLCLTLAWLAYQNDIWIASVLFTALGVSAGWLAWTLIVKELRVPPPFVLARHIDDERQDAMNCPYFQAKEETPERFNTLAEARELLEMTGRDG